MHKGNPEGNLLIIQDEPSKDDLEQNIPFTGPPGWRLKAWLDESGIDLKNTFFATLSEMSVDIENYPNLKGIVPLGQQSVDKFLVGYPPLKKIRGSIYNIERNIRVIPSIHPREVLFNTQLEYRCRSDWRKVKEQLDYDRFDTPERNHNISPDLADIKKFHASLTKGTVLSLDIETWGNGLKCVGFAANEKESIVIPTEEHYWLKRTGDKLDLHNAMDLIQIICEHGCEKLAQNGLFDAWWLLEYGIQVVNYKWDTLAMHHALWPRDNHSLDYLASIYTNQPYWKDEAKEADEIVKVAKQGMDKLYVYNGLDCTVTHEIYQRLREELEQSGMLGFYEQHYTKMYAPLLSLMREGVVVASDKMRILREELLNDARDLRNKASDIAEQPLFIFDKTKTERDMLQIYQKSYDEIFAELKEKGHKEETIEKKWQELQDKGISDTVLMRVMADMKLPKSATGTTTTGKMKADNISLRKVQKYYEDRKTESAQGNKITELIDIVLLHRRKKKLSSFLTESKIDTDSRLRCTYKFTTKTGRLASSKNPKGTGMNLQNIDRSLRDLFIASPGNILLEVDLSQAEARIVGALTGDDEMIRLVKRRPSEGDAHTENAVLIYSELYQREVGFDEITKEMRYLGKRAVHASGYGMRGNKLSDILVKEGFTFTPSECQKLIDAYMNQRPSIRKWQADIRKTILRDRYLQTSWGRSIDFLYDRMDDETYRFAYAYIPQSEIGDLTNQWMVAPVYHAIKEHSLKSRLIMQVHDAIIVDCVPEEAWQIMRFVKANVERPRIYGQSFNREIELIVPCEYGIGLNWKKAHEWKELPTKEETLEKIKEIMS